VRAAAHGAGRRWGVVAGLVAVLVALPPLVGALPASDAEIPVADLRDAALASADQTFSGYAESAGGLLLPVGTRRFSSVVDLFSDRTQMRVWWRGQADHRVDVVTAGGETGHHADGRGSWLWQYEADHATRFGRSALRLPSPPDLLPSSLGRRLLSEASAEELSRIGARRIAGRNALGLRISPAQQASSVRRVDVWVDQASGLPLQVQLFGRDGDLAALDTRFLDLDLTAPDPSVIGFTPPPGARVSRDESRGVLERTGRSLSRVPMPDALAGLGRRTVEGAPEAVGLYGRGVTLLAVVPVTEGLASDVARGLRAAPGAVSDDLGVRATSGPLGLMVINPPGDLAYVVAGTVTLDALTAAARALAIPEAGA
jgi:hypothetical protein